jgi:hypothetical protein
VREYRAPGSVRGPSGNRRSYLDFLYLPGRSAYGQRNLAVRAEHAQREETMFFFRPGGSLLIAGLVPFRLTGYVLGIGLRVGEIEALRTADCLPDEVWVRYSGNGNGTTKTGKVRFTKIMPELLLAWYRSCCIERGLRPNISASFKKGPP